MYKYANISRVRYKPARSQGCLRRPAMRVARGITVSPPGPRAPPASLGGRVVLTQDQTLQHGEDHDDGEENESDRGSLAPLLVAERDLVGQVGGGQRGPGRVALGDQEHLVENLP